MRARADVAASWQRPPIGPYSGRSLPVLWTRSWTSQTIQPFETAATTSQSHCHIDQPHSQGGGRRASQETPRRQGFAENLRLYDRFLPSLQRLWLVATSETDFNNSQHILISIYWIYTYIINVRCATVTLVIIWCREGRVPMRRGEQLAAVAEAHSSEFQCSWRLTAHETLQSTWRCNAAARSLKVHG